MRGRAAALPRDGSVTVLHGIGGVGKTRLALEIAALAEDAGVAVWWVQAGDRAAFEDGMRAVGYAAGASREDFAVANPADVVWRALHRLTWRWLLVVDNADDPAVAAGQGRGWMRVPRAPGAVVITSRDGRAEAWADWITCRPVEPLDAQAAAEVLLGLAAEAGSAAEARRLGERLSGIPLLLHLAGSALRQAGEVPARWAPPGALRTFDGYRAAVEAAAGVDGLYERIWEISLDQLDRAALSHGRELLLVICCFADAPLPYEEVLDPAALGVTAAELVRTLRGLEELGLVSLGPGELTVHPAVRTAARAHPELAPGLAAALLIAAAGRIGPGVAGVRAWARLGEHAAEVLGRVPGAGTAVLAEGAARLAGNGLHGQALVLYDALPGAGQDPGTRRARAGVLHEMGRHEEALAEFDAMLAGGHRGDLVAIRHGRAQVLREIGRHEEALAEFDAVVAIEDQPGGAVRRARASVLRKVGRYEEALAEFDALLAVGRRDTVLAIRHERARVLRAMRRHDEALAELDAVLSARRALHDERDYDVLNDRHQRARVLRELGRHGEALAEFDAVLAIERDLRGEQHDKVLAGRHQRARVLREMGRHDEALAEFDTLLAIERGLHDEQHNYVLSARHERAQVLRELGRHGEALPEFDALLAVERALHGEQHTYVLNTRHERARALVAVGRVAEALAEFEAVAEGRRVLHGAGHPRTRESIAAAESIRG